jgi:antitoxin FitA
MHNWMIPLEAQLSQLTVRGVDDRIVAALKLRAAKHRRSAEAEHRAILETVLGENAGDFWKDAEKMRAELAGRQHSDSADILRAERDNRHRGS